ncbi:MAG: transposase family protein [bacterium]|nr:transposase family protein [bacterium]
MDILKRSLTRFSNKKVAVDCLSILLWFEPMPNEEAGTISLAFHKMFQITRYPKRINMDQGRNLMSKLFSDLCLRISIRRSYTTMYHSSSNGEVEQTHRTIIQHLKMAILQTGDGWDEISPFMVQGYNTTQHSAHGKTGHLKFTLENYR